MFYNTDAKKFKDEFIKAQDEVSTSTKTDEQESNKLAKELEGLSVKESNDDEDKENKSENKDNETDSKTTSEVKEVKESETTATEDDKVKEEETTEDTPEK